jgi:hypothetical protein
VHSTEMGVGRGTGAGMIAAERVRQIVDKGYTLEHDDRHDDGSLGEFAGMILQAAMWECGPEDVEVPESAADWVSPAVEHVLEKWPNAVDRLRISGALVAAEIDRRIRAGGVEG